MVFTVLWLHKMSADFVQCYVMLYENATMPKLSLNLRSTDMWSSTAQYALKCPVGLDAILGRMIYL